MLGIEKGIPRHYTSMKQARIDSFMEQVFNVSTGFLLSALVWKLVVLTMITEAWINIDDTLLITGIFSIVSLARGFLVRRLFNGKKPWATIKQFCIKTC